jgi:putative hydrolase of the HAD superfamily
MIEPHIRALFFDAVGTLIEPDPPAVEIYASVGREHGSDLAAPLIAQRFRDAFQLEEARDEASAWSVSEERERERWRNIVAHVFGDGGGFEEIFADLWQHFSQRGAWRLAEGAGAVLQQLSRRGLVLGLASNFDRRLHAIADAMPELAPLQVRVISSEVGWRKPSPQFFQAMVRAAGHEARQTLYIGDRRDMDHDPARGAGLSALLLDAGAQETPGVRILRSLDELCS